MGTLSIIHILIFHIILAWYVAQPAIISIFISLNVLGCMRRFFAPDKEKCEAFLRAQKNVVEWGVGMERSGNDLAERSPGRRKAAKRIPFVEVVEFVHFHIISSLLFLFD